MNSAKVSAAILVLVSLFAVAMHVTKFDPNASMAVAEINRSDDVGPDRALSDRLIRFGQVAFDRGQFSEARHFFQKAIGVDPGHAGAWRKYNMALLAQISARVTADPGFLPDFSPGAGVSNAPPPVSSDTDDDDDGC